MKIINPGPLSQLIFPWTIWKIKTEKPELYLTFDDGPHPEYTPGILKILQEFGVKATFFVTGQKALLHPGIVRETIRDGHTIGNHGFSHQRLASKNKRMIREEILDCDRVIKNISGQKPVFFRPPHGRFDFRFKNITQELGKKLVIWSLLSYDYLEASPEKLIRRITSNLHPGAVIVLHDGHKNSAITLKTLPAILSSIKQLGYILKPFTTQ